MHRLARCIRFSINPFLPSDPAGFNSFASKPTGEGLAIFLELAVELTGRVAPETGFVVNVSDIDKTTREIAVPVFARRIREDFEARRHTDFGAIADMLSSVWTRLSDKFEPAALSRITLKLNPFRQMAIEDGNKKMVYFSEKFEFAATHKLWNDKFSEKENLRIFGKCANPTGHGHNYTIEVTIRTPGGGDFKVGDFERLVDAEVITLVDHKNLNTDVREFGSINPTVEHIAVFAWSKLAEKLAGKLHCVTVWETDKTSCSYYGPEDKTPQ